MGLPSPSPPSPPFFFNDTATTEIYTLSLHDALPICPPLSVAVAVTLRVKLVSLVGVIVRLDSVQPTTSTEVWPAVAVKVWPRSEDHTAALQSHLNIIERLLLEQIAAAVYFKGDFGPS